MKKSRIGQLVSYLTDSETLGVIVSRTKPKHHYIETYGVIWQKAPYMIATGVEKFYPGCSLIEVEKQDNK